MCDNTNTPSDLNINFCGDFYTPIKIGEGGLRKNSKIGLWFSTECVSNEENIVVSDFSKMYLPYFISNNENIKMEMKSDNDNALYGISEDSIQR